MSCSFALIISLISNTVIADQSVIKELQKGGKIVFIRHSLAPGSGDPEKINLKDFRLTFRSKYRAADIEIKKNSIVPGGLFEISKSDEKKLDIYENFPMLYSKIYLKYKSIKTMTYVMNSNKLLKPSNTYLKLILLKLKNSYYLFK